MSRPPRVDIAGEWYHVVARGNEKRAIFADACDYVSYLKLLNELTERFDSWIGAYCLMPNHVHLLLLRGRDPLARVMHSLQTRYVRYFNHRHDRVGHLFQGRYHAFRVTSDEYLETLVRYIHQNPVRACLATTVPGWRWTSDSFYRKNRVRFKRESRVPGFEGKEGSIRYLSLIRDAVQSSEINLSERDPGGTAERRKENRSRLHHYEKRDRPSVESIALCCASKAGVSVDALRNRDFSRKIALVRKGAMILLHEAGHGKSAIGRFFNLSPSAVTNALKKVQKFKPGTG